LVDLEKPWLALASSGRRFYPEVPMLAQPCPRGHATPAPGCLCGVVGRKLLDDALYPDRLSVSGPRTTTGLSAIVQLYLWGSRVEDDGYWRAQAAYPRLVCLPQQRCQGIPFTSDDPHLGSRALAEALASYYGCAVATVQTLTVAEVLTAAYRADPPIDHAAIRLIG